MGIGASQMSSDWLPERMNAPSRTNGIATAWPVRPMRRALMYEMNGL